MAPASKGKGRLLGTALACMQPAVAAGPLTGALARAFTPGAFTPGAFTPGALASKLLRAAPPPACMCSVRRRFSNEAALAASPACTCSVRRRISKLGANEATLAASPACAHCMCKGGRTEKGAVVGGRTEGGGLRRRGGRLRERGWADGARYDARLGSARRTERPLPLPPQLPSLPEAAPDAPAVGFEAGGAPR